MARKRSVILGCHCNQCMGQPKATRVKTKIQSCIRTVRQRTKQFLKKEEYEKALDVVVSTGYLD